MSNFHQMVNKFFWFRIRKNQALKFLDNQILVFLRIFYQPESF